MRLWERSDKRDESLNEKMVLLQHVGLNSFIGKGKYERRATSQQNAQRWEEQLSALCRYKEEYGDCNVPARANGEFKSLGMWVRSQRKAYSSFKFEATKTLTAIKI